MLTVGIALVVLVACCKVRWFLDRPSRRERDYAGGHIRLTTLWNEGAAFGLPIPKGVLKLLAGLGLGWLWLRRKEHPVGTGLLLGGGLSNLLERLGKGKVLDYLAFPKAPGLLRRYVYNLADVSVFLGAVALLLGKRRK